MCFGLEKVDTPSDASEDFVPVLVTVAQVTSQATLDFMGENLGNQVR